MLSVVDRSELAVHSEVLVIPKAVDKALSEIDTGSLVVVGLANGEEELNSAVIVDDLSVSKLFVL